MYRREVLSGAGVAATAGLAGCAGVLGSGCGGGQFDVGMSDSAFEPERVTVPVGETVVWRNTSQRAHTVTAYDGMQPEGAAVFASGGYESTAAARDGWRRGNGGAMHTCEEFEHTFETTGRHHYFCIPHERVGMVGTVVVEG